MLAALFFLGNFQHGNAQTPSDVSITNAKRAGMSSDKLDKIPPAVHSLIDDQQLAGAVVLVARKGQIVFNGSFGWADIAN